MSDRIQGSCLCQAVQFEVPAQPLVQTLCFCTHCQVISGANSYTAYVVPLTDLVRLKGDPGHYALLSDSGRTNTRFFCRDCGSRCWAELESGVASVNGMALHDRSHFKPTHNHRSDNAPEWCVIDQALEALPVN